MGRVAVAFPAVCAAGAATAADTAAASGEELEMRPVERMRASCRTGGLPAVGATGQSTCG